MHRRSKVFVAANTTSRPGHRRFLRREVSQHHDGTTNELPTTHQMPAGGGTEGVGQFEDAIRHTQA
ncbi:hypothetical protein [Aeoliella sp. SH292]|uniref:hypothetical protein n=1 Tax=Aeoliella sp. SH292 TaxID=3454464 RepID=UPI003F9D469A